MLESIFFMLTVVVLVIYLIYRIAFILPREISKSNESIELLRQQVREVSMKLNEINEKLDK